jgi:hypothetical protein
LQFSDGGEAIGSERKAGVIELGGIFVAARVVDLIQRVLPHLLNAALFPTIAAIALMISVSEYPFPYRDTLIVISWVILLTVAMTIMIIVALMNRNRLSAYYPAQLRENSISTVLSSGLCSHSE